MSEESIRSGRPVRSSSGLNANTNAETAFLALRFGEATLSASLQGHAAIEVEVNLNGLKLAPGPGGKQTIRIRPSAITVAQDAQLAKPHVLVFSLSGPVAADVPGLKNSQIMIKDP